VGIFRGFWLDMSGEYPICILLNKLTKRWHTIAFQPYPLPGQTGEKYSRYKSIGHHTVGFDTIEDAIAEIRTHDCFRLVGRVYAWNGLDMPAMVEFFDSAPSNENVDEVAAALTEMAGELLSQLKTQIKEATANEAT
jgi:hypothetical protein